MKINDTAYVKDFSRLCSIKENVKIKNTIIYNVLVMKMFCKKIKRFIYW